MGDQQVTYILIFFILWSLFVSSILILILIFFWVYFYLRKMDPLVYYAK